MGANSPVKTSKPRFHHPIVCDLPAVQLEPLFWDLTSLANHTENGGYPWTKADQWVKSAGPVFIMLGKSISNRYQKLKRHNAQQGQA